MLCTNCYIVSTVMMIREFEVVLYYFVDLVDMIRQFTILFNFIKSLH